MSTKNFIINKVIQRIKRNKFYIIAPIRHFISFVSKMSKLADTIVSDTISTCLFHIAKERHPAHNPSFSWLTTAFQIQRRDESQISSARFLINGTLVGVLSDSSR